MLNILETSNEELTTLKHAGMKSVSLERIE